MNKFKAYFEQGGEGCDYTIGCGMILIDLEATNWDAANEELVERMYDYGLGNIHRATLLEITKTLYIDVDDIKAAEEETRNEEKQREIEEQERKEFERLKQKFK